MAAAIKGFFTLLAKFPGVSGGPSQGTQYSLKKACKFCGAGAVPIGDRIVDRIPENSGRLFYTDEHELLVDDQLAAALETIGIQTLAKVVDLQSNVLPFKEVRPQATLPPFSRLTSGYAIEDQCEHCKRDGFFDRVKVDLKLVYENLDPDLFKHDVLVTYELFGTCCIAEPFSDSVFGRPKLIISDRLISLLDSESVKFFSTRPVQILTK